jgi:hypothetical protein
MSLARTPLYSVRSGQMVGALPVGVQTKGFDDAPYWPTQICWTYKEVWTQPVGQWVWLMQDVSVPAIVRGVADPEVRTPIEFREQKTGQKVLLHSKHSTRWSDLPDPTLWRAALRKCFFHSPSQGAVHHSFAIRTENLALSESPKQEIDLAAAGDYELVWHARVTSGDSPWVAVIFPDGGLNERRELNGAVSLPRSSRHVKNPHRAETAPNRTACETRCRHSRAE